MVLFAFIIELIMDSFASKYLHKLLIGDYECTNYLDFWNRKTYSIK